MRIAFLIKNEDIATSFRTAFEALWNIAHPVKNAGVKAEFVKLAKSVETKFKKQKITEQDTIDAVQLTRNNSKH